MSNNVYEKLQNVKVELQNTKLNKSGENKFAKFKYFELGDFLPTVNELFKKNKLHSVISFEESQAILTITNIENPEEKVIVKSPMVEISMKGANAIQSLGAVQTYQRRYLYMSALDIVENDVVDSQPMNQEEYPTVIRGDKQVVGCSLNQMQTISKHYNKNQELKQKLFKYYKIRDFSQLTKDEANNIIAKIKGSK